MFGISWFWFVGSLFQLALILAGRETLHVSEAQVGLLVTALAAGIGIGSIAAGAISGDHIELGLVPVGSVLMGAFSIALGLTTNYFFALAWLAGIGIAGGLFVVPLNAFLQERAEPREKGRLMATNNFANMLGVILASGVLWLVHDVLHRNAGAIMLGLGVVILAGTFYVVRVLPDATIRFALRVFAGLFFRIRITGRRLRNARIDPVSVRPPLCETRGMRTLFRVLQTITVERFRRSSPRERNWKPANWSVSFPKAALRALERFSRLSGALIGSPNPEPGSGCSIFRPLKKFSAHKQGKCMAILLIAGLFVMLLVQRAVTRRRFEGLEQELAEWKSHSVSAQELAEISRRVRALERPVAPVAESRVDSPPDTGPLFETNAVPAERHSVVAEIGREWVERCSPTTRLRSVMGGQEWESLVGANLLNKLGALILVIGIALFLGHSFAEDGRRR